MKQKSSFFGHDPEMGVHGAFLLSLELFSARKSGFSVPVSPF